MLSVFKNILLRQVHEFSCLDCQSPCMTDKDTATNCLTCVSGSPPCTPVTTDAPMQLCQSHTPPASQATTTADQPVSNERNLAKTVSLFTCCKTCPDSNLYHLSGTSCVGCIIPHIPQRNICSFLRNLVCSQII